MSNHQEPQRFQQRKDPIESVHRARDALQEATSTQAHLRRQPSHSDLYAYASAVTATVTALVQLTDLLADQIAPPRSAEITASTVTRQSRSGIHGVARELRHLAHTLTLAVADARRYWEAVDAAAEAGDNLQ